MSRYFLLSLLVAVTIEAMAVDVPYGSHFDRRIQYVNYNPDDVVVINALVGYATRIVFSPNEKILDIATGFTKGWEIADRRNILFIKPKSIEGSQQQQPILPTPGTWNTNLVVTTNLRLYDFDLRLSSGGKNGHSSKGSQPISYRVEFKYLEEQAEQNAKRAAKQAAEARMDSKTAPRNWNYSMQVGDESQGIAPTMAYDDGRFTYLKFPNNRDFPSVFLVAEDKTESIVNKHIDPNIPDVMVIHRVAREFALRLGNAVVGIYNESYDPDGIPATEGTTVPGVKRILKTKENTNG